MARPVCDIDGNYKASKCIPGQMWASEQKSWRLDLRFIHISIAGVTALIRRATAYSANLWLVQMESRIQIAVFSIQKFCGIAIYLIAITSFAECSRLSAKLNSIVDSKYPQYSMRCLDDGSFDPLHCMDNRCVCVSSTHGNQIGNPIYLIEDGLNKIPCCECRFHFPPTHTGRKICSFSFSRIQFLLQCVRNWRIVFNQTKLQCISLPSVASRSSAA